MKNKIIFFLTFLTGIGVKAGINDVVLTSTNLPLIVINTSGVDIPDGTKITATMKIIYNGAGGSNHPGDPGNAYNGYVGIEIRGSFSATLPQKPYGFETRDASGNSINVPILNMPADNDWILIANYNDKTFMRNTLAFNLFGWMGHYQPRTRLCEVILNNEYQGIYVLTEKIKRGKNRVDIAKLDLDDNAGDSLTGGYIIKIDNSNGSDGWQSTFEAIDRPGAYPYFIYTYPKPDVITEQQKTYIQGFINSLETELRTATFNDPVTGYPAYLNTYSFIDYFIISEISRNVDAYKKSAYFFKEKDSKGGLLNAGPVWDFDWAWKNINECEVDAPDGSGWTYEISSVCQSFPVPPGWMVKLLDDTTFDNKLNTRYFNLRKTILSTKNLLRYIDSIHTLVDTAQLRHYTKWPILGINVGTPEIPGETQPTTYAGEIAKFKDWVLTRISWLDENMPGRYIESINNEVASEKIKYRLFPNPAHDILVFESEKKIQQIEIFNSIGSRMTIKKSGNSYSYKIDVRNFLPGLYITKATMVGNEIIMSKFIVE
jgi:CotH kinase protein/Secretion system C-terminal sorting domain